MKLVCKLVMKIGWKVCSKLWLSFEVYFLLTQFLDRFFPLVQKVEVFHENVDKLVFSQLKSTVSGRVDCIQNQDCKGLSVSLKTGNEELILPVHGKLLIFLVRQFSLFLKSVLLHWLSICSFWRTSWCLWGYFV